MDAAKLVTGIIYDPIKRKTIPARITILNGRIEKIERDENVVGPIILPGFVDSHVHIESSMLVPAEFSRIALKHGTVAVVADPHEIANVAGVPGIDFMIHNSKMAEIKFFFGAPSCVPASPFDDCFDVIDSEIIEELMKRDDIYFLGEMMNFPGVISSNQDVIKKISAALSSGKTVDGHAPGLSSESLVKYVGAGISTDHECFSELEAVEKIKLGMKILIREGSAAKNFNALCGLIPQNPGSVMFCTDDCHPEDLIKGHINTQVRRSLELGFDIFDILQVATVNPIKHYSLNVGMLQIGDLADFIIVDNLENLNVMANFVNGEDLLTQSRSYDVTISKSPEYQFLATFNKKDIHVSAESDLIKVIEVIEGELVTNCIELVPRVQGGKVVSDLENDVLKIVVINRYKKDSSSVGFVKGFGLRQGAIAESIAHDSHHIIAVGVDDDSIYKAVEYVIKEKGGVCFCDGSDVFGLSLPVYGLMSNSPAELIAKSYENINEKVIKTGCKLRAPFMTLSFMALSVIPKLKITPRGLFDVLRFKQTDLFVR
jgi:adenine deaminase